MRELPAGISIGMAGIEREGRRERSNQIEIGIEIESFEIV
jgi:hypothetical protein